jgi:hypothetical protein
MYTCHRPDIRPMGLSRAEQPAQAALRQKDVLRRRLSREEAARAARGPYQPNSASRPFATQRKDKAPTSFRRRKDKKTRKEHTP